MTNKSGKIGTKAETGTVRAIKTRGFPSAERKRPTGTLDCGDITGTPGICWQVKGGKAAANASDNQIAQWLEAADKQRANGGADIAVLVVKRSAISEENAHRWWAVVTQATLYYLTLMADRDIKGAPGYSGSADTFRIVASDPESPWAAWKDAHVRLYLEDMCALLVAAGYGDAPAVAS